MTNFGKLKLLVNDIALYQAFQEYVDHQLALAHKGLEQASDLRVIGKYQGQAELLNRMKLLREEINGGR